MTGKCMPYGCVEVVIKLKAPPLKLYEGEVNDRIVIRLQPNPHLIFVSILNLLGLVIILNGLLSPTPIPKIEQSTDMKNSSMMQ